MRLSPPLIDPALPIDTRTRRKIRRVAWRKWNENPAKGITFGLLAAAPLFLTTLLPPAMRTTQLGIPALAIVAITYIIYICILAQILRRFWYAPYVYAELRTRGYDVCPKCGYWLRDLDDDIQRCPECGRTREAIPASRPR
jgi:ssDNA-binding Zn-finger/Zn-ribbon topoisomerase 1